MEIFLTIEIICAALDLSEREYRALIEKHGGKGIFTQARLNKITAALRQNSVRWFHADESEFDWKNLPRQIKRMLSTSPPKRVSIGKTDQRLRSRSGR